MHVLLVEDSVRLSRSLSNGLTREGFVVDAAMDGEEAKRLLQTNGNSYEIVILDLMIPKIDGLTLLSWLRSQKLETHVLILSAKDQVEDRISGLDLGADDYLVKPFDFGELCSRLQALKRRHVEHKSPVFHVGDLQVDTLSRSVKRGQVELELTASEYRLFEFLVLRAGRVFSKDHLMSSLYPVNTYVTQNTLEVLVSSLRKTLGKDADLVQTKRGHGYYVAVDDTA